MNETQGKCRWKLKYAISWLESISMGLYKEKVEGGEKVSGTLLWECLRGSTEEKIGHGGDI